MNKSHPTSVEPPLAKMRLQKSDVRWRAAEMSMLRMRSSAASTSSSRRAARAFSSASSFGPFNKAAHAAKSVCSE